MHHKKKEFAEKKNKLEEEETDERNATVAATALKCSSCRTIPPNFWLRFFSAWNRIVCESKENKKYMKKRPISSYFGFQA